MSKWLDKKRILVVLASSHACLSLIILLFSVTTDLWLFTYERQHASNDTLGSVIIATNSGLWRKCMMTRHMPNVNEKTLWNKDMIGFSGRQDMCTNIHYFYFKVREGDNPTDLILYAMQPTTYFIMSGFVTLIIGCSILFLSFVHQSPIYLYFVSGICFVLSGLCLLVGIVFYVGSVSETFDNDAKNLEGDQKYVYQYGISFYVSMFSFISTEFSGIYVISLYIGKKRMEKDAASKKSALLTNTDICINDLKNCHTDHAELPAISSECNSAFRHQQYKEICQEESHGSNLSQRILDLSRASKLNSTFQSSFKNESCLVDEECQLHYNSPNTRYLTSKSKEIIHSRTTPV